MPDEWDQFKVQPKDEFEQYKVALPGVPKPPVPKGLQGDNPKWNLRDFITGKGGMIRTGLSQTAEGVEHMAEPGKEAKYAGATTAIRGLEKAATPAAIPLAIANPVGALYSAGGAMAGGFLAKEATEAGGGGKEAQELAETLGEIPGAYLGTKLQGLFRGSKLDFKKAALELYKQNHGRAPKAGKEELDALAEAQEHVATARKAMRPAKEATAPKTEDPFEKTRGKVGQQLEKYTPGSPEGRYGPPSPQARRNPAVPGGGSPQTESNVPTAPDFPNRGKVGQQLRKSSSAAEPGQNYGNAYSQPKVGGRNQLSAPTTPAAAGAEATPETATPSLDEISQGYMKKPFKALKPEDQAKVRNIAKNLEANKGENPMQGSPKNKLRTPADEFESVSRTRSGAVLRRDNFKSYIAANHPQMTKEQFLALPAKTKNEMIIAANPQSPKSSSQYIESSAVFKEFADHVWPK
jgi:hypothetical protein